MYPGQDLALNGDVIVVTFNYRLGINGFMTTNSSAAPANLGLWDAALALKWTYNNIAKFSGDPKKITVMGQSAGAVAAAHLANSPHTKKYIKRVIALSGSNTNFFAVSNYFRHLFRRLYIPLSCWPLEWFGFDSWRVECLSFYSIRVLELFGVQLPAVAWKTGSLSYVPMYVPIVDGDFIPDDPKKLLKEGAAKDIDLLIGYTKDECAGMLCFDPLGKCQIIYMSQEEGGGTKAKFILCRTECKTILVTISCLAGLEV